MAVARKTLDGPRSDKAVGSGFIVTKEVVVGTVKQGNGEFLTPTHAAFDLIATDVASGESGVYRFPDSGEEFGRLLVVTVTHGVPDHGDN